MDFSKIRNLSSQESEPGILGIDWGKCSNNVCGEVPNDYSLLLVCLKSRDKPTNVTQLSRKENFLKHLFANKIFSKC